MANVSRQDESFRQYALNGDPMKVILSSCAPLALFQALQSIFKILDAADIFIFHLLNKLYGCWKKSFHILGYITDHSKVNEKLVYPFNISFSEILKSKLLNILDYG